MSFTDPIHAQAEEDVKASMVLTDHVIDATGLPAAARGEVFIAVLGSVTSRRVESMRQDGLRGALADAVEALKGIGGPAFTPPPFGEPHLVPVEDGDKPSPEPIVGG